MGVAEHINSELLRRTGSLCSVCHQGIDAEIYRRDDRIYMRKTCPTHGERTVLIASDAHWYERVLSYPAALKAPPVVTREVEHGCPFDCGACSAHEQRTYLPVIPITSACNLDCPICYTINKNENAYHISLSEFDGMIEAIRKVDPELKIINLTGGEPTLHPQFLEIIRKCHSAGFHRITISTHGLSLIRNEALLEELAALRARMVLSFDSFDDDVNEKMLGARLYSAKMKVLDQFEKFEIDTTLIPVIALGLNDHEIGKFINLLHERKSIRSLEIHSMTFTGQGGTDFNPESRITTPDILRRIEMETSAAISMDDFIPSPCAHPLCYQTCYLLKTDSKRFVPFARFMTSDQIRRLLTDNLYIEPGPVMEEVLQDAINNLWANHAEDSMAKEVMLSLKQVAQELFASRALNYAEQQRIAERCAKTIYIHAHMDEENFDTDRIRQCCVGVPAPDGGNIPTCSYNILYRGRDARFATKPLPSFGSSKLLRVVN